MQNLQIKPAAITHIDKLISIKTSMINIGVSNLSVSFADFRGTSRHQQIIMPGIDLAVVPLMMM